VSGEGCEQYLALSHRWGDANPTTTIKSNLEYLSHGFEISELSKSFQDAIAVTKSLGFNYIWIDCLCIVQDDDVEWTEEAGHMAAIYSSCVLVIAASRAADCNAGFLQSRPQSDVVGTYQFLNMDFEIHARDRISHKYQSNGLAVQVGSTPLFERGWYAHFNTALLVID
jgi:hypothetical protein